MQIGIKFSVSIHILLFVECFKNEYKITSDLIASSVKTNPVVIRKLMCLLKNAGLIIIYAGTGGIELTRKPSLITFLDIYRAVNTIKDGGLFKVHDGNKECPIAKKINILLADYFYEAQTVLEKKLKSYTLQDLLNNIKANSD